MDQDDVVFLPIELCRRLYSVVDGQLPRGPAGNDLPDLVQTVPVFHVLHIGDPVLQTGHDNAVDFLMVLEDLYGMYDNGLSVDQQKLLGPVLGMHPPAGSAGEDYGYVQWFFSFFIKRGRRPHIVQRQHAEYSQ